MAWDENLNRKVIIKGFKSLKCPDLPLARLYHPCIAIVIDLEFSEENRSGYLIMEYVEGCSLEDALVGMRPSEKNEVFINILKGIYALHQEGIYHGDLHLGNIVFDRKNGIPKIIDSVTINPNGTINANPNFTAPESMGSKPNLGLEMDIFSFGRLIEAFRDDVPIFIPEISKCVSNDPKNRPTAGELLKSLNKKLNTNEGDRKLRSNEENIFLKKRVILIALSAIICFAGTLAWKKYNFENSRSEDNGIEQVNVNLKPERWSNLKNEGSLTFQTVIAHRIAKNSLKDQPQYLRSVDEIQASFAFPYDPFVIINDKIITLGHYVRFNDQLGFVCRIGTTYFMLEMEDGPFRVNLPTAQKTFQKIENIYVVPKGKNFRKLIGILAKKYDLEIIDEGGKGGAIAGYFSDRTIKEFFSSISKKTSIQYQLDSRRLDIKYRKDFRFCIPLTRVLWANLQTSDILVKLKNLIGFKYMECDIDDAMVTRYYRSCDWETVVSDLGLNVIIREREEGNELELFFSKN